MTADNLAKNPAPWKERLRPDALALDQALKLVKNGLPVFPCNADKRPTLAGGFKNASKDATEVRDLWRRGPGRTDRRSNRGSVGSFRY